MGGRDNKGKFYSVDLVGKRVGILTVVSRSSKTTSKGEYFWDVLCDCGNKKSYKTSRLTTLSKNGAKSCGCLVKIAAKKTGPESKTWKGYMEISGSQFRRIVEGAVKRGIPFTLTIEDIWDVYLKQDRRCPYTGSLLYFDKTGYLDRYSGNLSVDRVDSNIGYEKSNIQLVQKRVNLMKGSLPHQEFVDMCSLIASKFRSREVYLRPDTELIHDHKQENLASLLDPRI